MDFAKIRSLACDRHREGPVKLAEPCELGHCLVDHRHRHEEVVVMKSRDNVRADSGGRQAIADNGQEPNGR
jgi:hypothetical protein